MVPERVHSHGTAAAVMSMRKRQAMVSCVSIESLVRSRTAGRGSRGELIMLWHSGLHEPTQT
jgi:hypothetical protein